MKEIPYTVFSCLWAVDPVLTVHGAFGMLANVYYLGRRNRTPNEIMRLANMTASVPTVNCS